MCILKKTFATYLFWDEPGVILILLVFDEHARVDLQQCIRASQEFNESGLNRNLNAGSEKKSHFMK